MGVSDQLHAPAVLSPGKETPPPTRQETGGAPEPVWTRCRREKFRAPAGIRTPITCRN